MNKHTIIQIGSAVILLGVAFFGVTILLNKTAEAPTQQPSEQQPSPQQTQHISLTIEGLYTDTQVAITADDTVLSMLQALDAEDPDLALVTTEYAGLGTLVESIAGKTNGENDNYWQYVVNGAMPQVGADQLRLNDGDSVEWRFEASEF